MNSADACAVRRVRYEKRGAVAHVTLDRPAKLNALDLQTHAELAAIWDDYESDPALRVAVLTGAGTRAFSAGQDLHELASYQRADVRGSSFGSRGAPGYPRLTERFELSKPVVARVNGLALGGGFELVMACDLAIAASTAEFGLPEARLGLVAGAGGLLRLPRQMPYRQALGYLMTGRRMPAARALEFGLLNEVVEPEDLDRCVDGWVEDILRCAPLSIRAIKSVVHGAMHLGLEEAFSRTYPWEERRRAGHDRLEGPRAFSERRPPQWRDHLVP